MACDDSAPWQDLFDGSSLRGWHAVPRVPTAIGPGWPQPAADDPHFERAAVNMATWAVVDGAIVGSQQVPGGGYGGYLLTDETFGDFELEIDAHPDWPADTGIMLRASDIGSQGYQVLLDHRQSGGIGGLYGNGIGGFHAVGFTIDARRDAQGRAVGLRGDDPRTSVEPFSEAKRQMLSDAATLEEFLGVWRWDDWNTFRIRCEGVHPVITVWINELLVARCVTADLPAELYRKTEVEEMLGHRGRIALEVHDNDLYLPPGLEHLDIRPLGEDRWGKGAVCRWRRVRVRELA